MKYSEKEICESDTVYMLLTDRFFDGNPLNNGVPGEEYRPGQLRFYQGGDWAGLREKLSYIKSLGFTAVWMSPPQDNEKYNRPQDEAGYHGYYTHDYYRPNPHFGTKDELKSLFAAADALGLKLILDAQINHMADYLEYPCQTYDPPEYRPAPPFDNPEWFHNTPNIVNFENDEELQNYSLGGLDDLAQENPDCWNALTRAYLDPVHHSGWMTYGFAAARIDVAMQVPPKYLRLFEQHIGKHCFGEALTPSVDKVAALQNEIYGMLDYPLYFAMDKTLALQHDWSDVKRVLDQDKKYIDARRLMTFIDNHDRARFLSNCGGNIDLLRLSLAFLFTVRGIPVIYYGTEQSMRGDGCYCDENENEANREMMTCFDPEAPVAKWIRRLNLVRAGNKPTLCLGEQEEIYYCPDDSVYAFSRHTQDKKQEVLCIFNASSECRTRQIPLKDAPGRKKGLELENLLLPGQIIRCQADHGNLFLIVSLEPNEAMILKPLA